MHIFHLSSGLYKQISYSLNSSLSSSSSWNTESLFALNDLPEDSVLPYREEGRN